MSVVGVHPEGKGSVPVTQLDAAEASDEQTEPSGSLHPAGGPEESPTRRRRLGRRGVVGLIGAAVLLLGGAGYGAWALLGSTTDAATTQYRTQTVSKETLKSTVSATGTLNPAKQSELSFSSPGTVTSVEVHVGDKVSRGDVIARMDDDELQIDADAAAAELAEARDSLDELEDDDDATATALASARASVQVKENAVVQAEEALDDATLVAPFAGTIAAVGIEKGDTVGSSSGSTTGSSSGGTASGASSSGSSSTGTSSSITVISTGTFVVDTSVSNTDLTSITKGLQATITPTGSEEPVFGTVSSVGVMASGSSSSSGTTTSGSSTFPVTIAVTGKHTDLLPGSSVTVAITTKQLDDVISVPTQAITTVDGTTVVQKLVDGTQVQTEVTIGQVVGRSTAVTKGLEEGDEIVVASFTASAGTGSRSGTDQNQGFPGGQPGGVPVGGQGGPPDGGGTGGGAAGGGGNSGGNGGGSR